MLDLGNRKSTPRQDGLIFRETPEFAAAEEHRRHCKERSVIDQTDMFD